MGAEPWLYFVPYDRNVPRALAALRQREFQAGRYNPALPFIEDFPITADTPGPGAQHPSIEAAIADAEADGTRSILDIESASDTPDFGVVVPLSEDTLTGLYGSPFPTRDLILKNLAFLEGIDRGQGVYFVVYEGEQPSELCFAGYSCD